MKQQRGRVVRIESLEELDRRLAQGVTSLRGWRLRGIDLTERSAALARLKLTGASFLGCRLTPADAERAEEEGALVLPNIPEVPVDVYRAGLYTAAELYDTLAQGRGGYTSSLDARAYAWSQEQRSPDDALARTLHDHAIDEALEAWLAARHLQGGSVVGVMGGHALQRGQEEYADAAMLGRALALGRPGEPARVVATGGGPGAMEAANLGAWLADHDDSALTEALGLLAGAPAYRPSIEAWARRALEVRERFGEGRESLGIPTWHYGHEPPNAFAGAIAKYFRNATREAVLLQVCDAGIVFLPGAAGTVQEVFQDACENYYADETAVAPMVLLGKRYWTEELPLWPLLERLAHGRVMEGRVHLADDIDEAVALLDG